EAAERLRGCVAAADLLEEAALSSDAEVRGSARSLLKEIDARRVDTIALRMAARVMGGHVDLLPDHARRWARHDKKDIGFHVASMLATEVRAKAYRLLDPKTRWRVARSNGDLLTWAWSPRKLWAAGYD